MLTDSEIATGLAVPKGWHCAPLDELVDPERGISYGIVQPGPGTPDGVPIIRVNNLRAGRIQTEEALRVASQIEAGYARTRLRGGEVLLSLVGTLGECAVVPQALAGWNVARAVAVIPLRDGIDADWVAMCLRSSVVQSLVHGWATTTVQATLNLRDVRRLPILLAPEPDRSEITRAVKQLDDKIEQNRRTGRKLEGLARAVFKAWFVDFEPVKAKAAGATAFPGMPAATFAALPTRLVESRLGPVPEGWQVKTIEDVAEKVGMGPFGSSIKVSTFQSEGIPVISGQHLNGLMLEDSVFNFVAVEHADRLRSANVFRGDVILTHAGNVGQVAYIPETSLFDRYVISQRQFFIRCRHGNATPRYLTYWFRSPDGQHALKANMSQTGVPSLSRPVTYVRSLQVLAPAITVLAGFDTVVGEMDRCRAHLSAESAKLTTLRDYLLPRLLSGSVRVRGPIDSR